MYKHSCREEGENRVTTRYVLREIEIDTDGERLALKRETHKSTIYEDITEFVAATDARRCALTAQGYEAAVKLTDLTVIVYTSQGRSVALSTSTLED